MASATAEESRAIEALQEALRTLQQDQQREELTARAEVRSLEFWRAIIAECLGSFLFLFLTCSALDQQPHPLGSAFAPGVAALALVYCFADVSGAHLSPAVTVAMAATRRISPLRALMYVTAQCGGAIAGAALLYGVSNSPTPLQMAPPTGEPWQLFGLEAVLAFPVALCYFVAKGSSLAPAVAAAYLASSLAALPKLNPARALGPAFVLHKWDHHWVYWFGPLLGAVLAGTLYEFILNPRRGSGFGKSSNYEDSLSVASDPDNYEDLDKGYTSLRPGQQTTSPMSPNGGFCGATSVKNEPIYSPRSLYAATSPPLTRANLNRSQSVYAKTPPASLLTRTQPTLQPAHSLYPGLQVCRTYTAPRPFVRPEPIYTRQQPSPAEESAYGSATYKKREYHNY